MKPQNVLIFGSSGQVGRHLLRKLTKNNYKCTAVTRSVFKKGFILKTQASAGWIDCVEVNIFDEKSLRGLINKADICINLIGILFEKGTLNTFQNIHSNFPNLISKICNEENVKQFIQLSALGIEEVKNSFYARSKLNGETFIKKYFPSATILRPSIIFSVDDSLTTKFMTLLNRLPFFPLFGNPNFMPIHVSDVTNIIYHVIDKEIKSTTIECIGPETISLKEILERLLKLINKKRLIIPLPILLSKLIAKTFRIFPNPPITEDQLRLLSYNNVATKKYKTNFDIGVPSISMFNQEVESYCYMWKDQGQFSTKKYNNKN
jgi:NADH dehydrogenase